MFLTDIGSRPYDVMYFSILEISDNDISGTGRPIEFVFDSRVGFFLRMSDRMDLFQVGPFQDGGFVFDSGCLLSAASEPHCLPACSVLIVHKSTACDYCT